MSATTTMAVPGIELAHMGQYESQTSSTPPSLRRSETPLRDPNHGTVQDHGNTKEAPNPPTRTIPLAAHELDTPAPIPTVRLTAYTEQSSGTSAAGGSAHTRDGSAESAGLRQAGSGPPSPSGLSTQSTPVPPSISSDHTLPSNRAPSSLEILFPGLSRVVKADSIHYQRTRHLLGKIFSLMTIVVTLLGTNDTHCQTLQHKHLAAPPYDSERFLVTGRDLLSSAHATIKSSSHLWILAIIIVPVLLMTTSLLLVYFASRRPKPHQPLPQSVPNGYNVRTQIPASWATDPDRRIYLDESYSTSAVTNFSYRSSSITTTANGSIRHPSLDGPQQPVKRLKIASHLKDPSSYGATTHTSSHDCDHDWHSEWQPQGWRDYCKKCKLEIVDGPTYSDIKAKREEWEKKRKEMKEELKGDVEERMNRANIALHKTLMKIINREPLDGAHEVGAVRVGEDGEAEIELSSARLGALGLMRWREREGRMVEGDSVVYGGREGCGG